MPLIIYNLLNNKLSLKIINIKYGENLSLKLFNLDIDKGESEFISFSFASKYLSILSILNFKPLRFIFLNPLLLI